MRKGRIRDNRIPIEQLQEIGASLFGNRSFTGTALAKQLGERMQTVWARFYRIGLEARQAEEIADVLDGWVVEIMNVSIKLRALAKERRMNPIPFSKLEDGTVHIPDAGEAPEVASEAPADVRLIA